MSAAHMLARYVRMYVSIYPTGCVWGVRGQRCQVRLGMEGRWCEGGGGLPAGGEDGAAGSVCVVWCV